MRFRFLLFAALCFAGRLPAQFIGYVSPQTVQQTLATAVSCTGANQVFPVQNLGQTQHFAYLGYTTAPTKSVVQIEGVDVNGNTTVISDTAQAGPQAIEGLVSLVGNGYFPKTQVHVVCLSPGVFNLTYQGGSATPYSNLGTQINTQIDKVLFNTAPANATSISPIGLVAVTPFGSSAGVIAFKYGAAGPSGSTINVNCGGGTVSFQLNGASPYFSITFPIATAATVQLFTVPPMPCPEYITTYTSGGASATTFDAEWFFTPLGAAPGGAPGVGDPCQAVSILKTSAVITAPAAATTQIVGLVAGKTIYACGFSITGGGAAGTAQFVTGTGAACAAGQTNLTGAYTTAIGQAIEYGAGAMTIFATPVSQALCITMVGAGATAAGVLSYVQQ